MSSDIDAILARREMSGRKEKNNMGHGFFFIWLLYDLLSTTVWAVDNKFQNTQFISITKDLSYCNELWNIKNHIYIYIYIHIYI